LANIRKQQLEISRQKISLLPFFDSLPQVKELRQKVIKGKEHDVRKKQETHFYSEGPRITQCYCPPYSFGVAGINAHAVSLDDITQELGLKSAYGYANHVTGEMSLASISGQHFYDFYRASEQTAFFGLHYRSVEGVLMQTVDLHHANTGPQFITIDVSVELPSNYNNAIELYPGWPDDYLMGCVGVEGYLLVFAEYTIHGNSVVTPAMRDNFLLAFRNTVSNEVYIFYRLA
jgi:hypothetical protein